MWFHAFNRENVADAVDVLMNGPRHHPDENNATRRHERLLGIEPPRVYAYLGRTIPTFGENALALHERGLIGQMTPFDSGGLVAKMQPAASLDPDAKLNYLRKATWSTRTRNALLAAYPTSAKKSWNAYLDGRRPVPAGPHEVWSRCEVAAIWRENTDDDWRCWTWEGRATTLDLSALRAWTCVPGRTKEIVEFIRNNEGEAAPRLLARFRHGGVSKLVAELKSEQAA